MQDEFYPPTVPTERRDGAGIAKLSEILQTSSLRLSEIEACSCCEEFLGNDFRVLDVRFGVIREMPDASSSGCPGFPEAVAFALKAHPELGVVIGEDSRFTCRLYLCRNCFNRPIDLPMAGARAIARRAMLAGRKNRNWHLPAAVGLQPTDPVWALGDCVRFAHIPPGGPQYKVTHIAPDKMIEIDGFPGQFAASCFVPGEKSGLPSGADLDADAAEKRAGEDTE